MTTTIAVSEKQHEAAIRDYAALTGWLVYHPFDSRRSSAGWPDLAMVRRGRLVFAELKTERGRVSEGQQRWLQELEQAGAEAYVWRPSDWAEIERVLL